MYLLGAFAACLNLACGSSSDNSGPGGGAGGTGGVTGTGGTSTGDPYYDAVPAVRLAGDINACPAGFENPVQSGQHSAFIAAGQSRGFWLSLPEATFSGPRPVLVLFNGTGESGQIIFNRAQGGSFVNRGFIVIAPDSNGNGAIWPVWDGLRVPGTENDPNPDLDLMDALLACTAAHQEVDQNRIYVAGHSAGGIISNHILQRRSQLLAGGIVASGVFDTTSPSPKAELDALSVLVTWGGDNDAYSGSASGVNLPTFNFVEQAAIASAFYEGAPKVEQAWCKGANVGHAWLSPANDWMVDFLLAHPKGLTDASPWQLAQPPTPAVSCGTDVVPPPTGTSVICGPSTTSGCQNYCQFIGDCVAENATVSGPLGPQLTALGFSGPGNTSCTNCIPQCEADAVADASDAAVVACFDTAFGTAQCGPGIPGAQPFIDAVNNCCQGKTASGICKRACGTIKSSSLALSFFPTCKAF